MKRFLLSRSGALISVFTIILLGLISCSPLVYQVVELNSEALINKDDAVVFENSDLKVSYNFWSDGGQIGFTIFNKTDKPIYIDWDKTHLIYNGLSYEYWFDIENNTAVSVTRSGSYGLGHTSYYNLSSFFSINTSKTITNIEKSKPKRILELPPQSSIYTQKFHLINAPYFTCDFNFKHTSKGFIELAFEKSNSPITFRNYFTYSFDKNCDAAKVIDNSFYASRISNMVRKMFRGESKTGTNCDIKGNIINEQTFEYPYYKPNRFFWNTIKK